MSPEELATIIEKHRKWWNGEDGGERADLQGANLQDADLRRADLQGANLQDANLQDANLQDADLRHADLQGVDLRRADLQGANLQDADLQGADLRRADLQGANLQDANLRRADLRRADLQGADLQGADLRHADLRHADLQGVDLQGANLQDADLQGADLRRADLDFACWPLWCGSLGVKVDTRVAAQIAYHFCRLDCDDPGYLTARAALREFATTFHRMDECGQIDVGPVPDACPTIEIRGPEVWVILRRRDGELTGIRAVAISTVEEYGDMLAVNAEAMDGEDGAVVQESIFLTECRDRSRAEMWAEQINAAIIEWIGGDLS